MHLFKFLFISLPFAFKPLVSSLFSLVYVSWLCFIISVFPEYSRVFAIKDNSCCILLHCAMGSMHGGISSEGVRMLDNFRRS